MDQPLAHRPGKRWKKVLKWIALSILTIVVLFLFGVAPYWLSTLLTRASTRPWDRAITTTPADLGANYRDVTFTSTDGVNLSGWYLPAEADKDKTMTIVLAHGLFRSRHEVLGRAVDLWKLGYSALVFDLRNHGHSGKSPCSFGYLERQDVAGAVRFARTLAPTNRIVACGVSMGAAAVLLAVAETDNVAGVIADSTFLNFDDVVRNHAGLLFKYVPPLKYPLAYEFVAITDWRLGIDSHNFDMRKAVKKIRVPILFITGSSDHRMPSWISFELSKLSSNPETQVWQVPNAGHGHAYDTNPTAYTDHLAAFLGQR